MQGIRIWNFSIFLRSCQIKNIHFSTLWAWRGKYLVDIRNNNISNIEFGKTKNIQSNLNVCSIIEEKRRYLDFWIRVLNFCKLTNRSSAERKDPIFEEHCLDQIVTSVQEINCNYVDNDITEYEKNYVFHEVIQTFKITCFLKIYLN